jgi:hypothetical protein
MKYVFENLYKWGVVTEISAILEAEITIVDCGLRSAPAKITEILSQ